MQTSNRRTKKNVFAVLTLAAALGAFSSNGVASAQTAQPATSAIPQTAAEPTPITGALASLGVFKNGIVVVEEKFVVPGPGRYAVSTPPSPLHGTFFVASDAPVQTTATTRDAEIPIAEATSFDWTTDFAGRSVRVLLPGEKEPRTVTIVPTAKPDANESNPDFAFSSNYRYNPGGAQSVLLQGENGETILLNASGAASLQVVSLVEGEKFETVVRKRPRLIFDVGAKPNGENGGATIRLFYLTRGATWSPQYRVALLDAQTLEIEQTAVLANEFRSFENVPVALFSGFPQISMQEVLSPMAPNADLASFFAALTNPNGGNAFYARRDASQMLTNQAVVSFNARDASALGANFGAASGNAAAFGEGVDVFAQDVGRQTLAKNDRKLFSVAKKTTPCRRVVCWNISDARDANGRFVSSPNPTQDGPTGLYGRTTSGEVALDNSNRFAEPWDALQFVNPFDFPLTTGPATVLSGSKFLGQNSLFWTNPNEKTLLPITKALSVRVRSIENERDMNAGLSEDEKLQKFDERGANPERFYWFEPKLTPEYWGKTILVRNSYFRVAVIDATITLENGRDEETPMILSRQFSGVALPESFEGFDKTPETAILSDSSSESGAFNRRNELRWTTTLQPKEKRTLKFSYQTLIAQ